MLLRRNLLLLLTCLALAACTTKDDGPSFGDLEPGSLDDSGSTAMDGGSTTTSATCTRSLDDGGDPERRRARRCRSRWRRCAGDGRRELAEAGSNAETGRLEGITAAQRRARDGHDAADAARPDVVADARGLCAAMGDAARQQPLDAASSQHRSGADLQAKNYGENLRRVLLGLAGNVSTAQAVDVGIGGHVLDVRDHPGHRAVQHDVHRQPQ